jgi:hypothetical protein
LHAIDTLIFFAFAIDFADISFSFIHAFAISPLRRFLRLAADYFFQIDAIFADSLILIFPSLSR